MKFTSKILLALLVVLIGGLLSSNIILKREYDKVDKTDIYWNYEKISGYKTPVIRTAHSHFSKCDAGNVKNDDPLAFVEKYPKINEAKKKLPPATPTKNVSL